MGTIGIYLDLPLGFEFSIESPLSYSEMGIIFFEKKPAIADETESFIQTVAIILATHHAALLGFQENEHFGADLRGAAGAPDEMPFFSMTSNTLLQPLARIAESIYSFL